MPPRTENACGSMFSRDEVSVHSKKDDCWIILDNKVYDITTWGKDHPGGMDILETQAGRDATVPFHNFHHPDSFELLPNYYVGEVKQEKLHPRDAKKEAIIRDYNALADECRRLGYFKASKLFYTWKLCLHMSWVAAAVWLAMDPTSTLRVLLSATFMGVFYAQSGWLSHDFMHHQVFENRFWGDFFGQLTGGLWQGFSVSWWKNKHNTHHACSNELDNDPDIDSLPFLSFHPVLLRGGDCVKTQPKSTTLIPIQTITFFPIIALARLNWSVWSIIYAFGDIGFVANRRAEQAMIIAHWGIKFAFMAYAFPFWTGLWWCAFAEALGGCMIGLFFVLNHNGMQVYTEEEYKDMDFITLQVLTSRDVTSNFVSDFLTGGLNFQVEHHLFPTIPRHHFRKVQPLVRNLCEKHGIDFHCVDMMDGFREFFGALGESEKMMTTRKFDVPKAKLPHYPARN